MNKKDIVAVMKKFPDLTIFGFGVFFDPGQVQELRDAEFLRLQVELLETSAERCTEICEWLKQVAKTKTMNRCAGSYGLKHAAEADIGKYCTNGEFICAAIHMGFECRKFAKMECRRHSYDNPNAYFNMSRRSLSVLDDKRDGGVRRQHRAEYLARLKRSK